MASESASDQSVEEPKASRSRSPNHPSLSLSDAIEKMKILHDKYIRTAVPIPIACAQWGYKNPRSSGALQIQAAVKAYGLADASESGGVAKLAVSESAEHIIRNAPDRSRLLQEAALTPPIHRELWDHYNHQLPHDDVLSGYLKWERAGGRFTDDAVGAFITRFRESLRYAGLLAADGSAAAENNQANLDTSNNGTGTTAPRTVQVGLFVQWISAGVQRFPVPKKVVGIKDNWAFVEGSPTGLAMSELEVVDAPVEAQVAPPANPYFRPLDEPTPADDVAKEITTLDEGAVVLTLPKDLSPESVGEFDYWVQGLLRRMRRKAGLGADGKPLKH